MMMDNRSKHREKKEEILKRGYKDLVEKYTVLN